MPLVRRMKRAEVLTTHSKVNIEHILYVRPKDMKPGDVVVKPTPKQLIELAEKYPREFGKAAQEAGIELDGDKTDAFSDAPNWQAAVAAIEAEESLEVLAGWYAEETERAEPRKSVLEAFAAKGFEG